MPRYSNTIKTDESPESLGEQIAEYLTHEGFKQVDPVENIWKKGMGIMLGPQYVRFRTSPGSLLLEAWIKFAIVPGVYVGEMGIEGMFALIPKRKLKARVEEIEHLA